MNLSPNSHSHPLLKRLTHFAWGVLQKRPFNVLLQITNRCNMKCSFCDFWPHGAPPLKELSLRDYEKLAEELASLGTFLISIEGGEPFVRPDLIEIIRIFSQKHLPILYTNGWYVTPENAQALFDAGLHQVGVSIDFATALKHDQKRKLEGACEKAWNAIRFFREAAPAGKAQVHVMTVLMKENKEEIKNLLERSKDEGVNHCLTLLSTQGFRRNTYGDEWPDASFAESLPQFWKKYPHLMVFSDYLKNVEPFLTHKKLPQCQAGQQSFNIDHLGNVAPCIEKIDRIFGNVREESLEAILEKMQNLEEVAQCQSCWTLCRGVSQSLGNGGSWKGWLELSTRMRGS
jgi:MoaA/NifB/PqqE/SkfB family radical SAM enzyme